MVEHHSHRLTAKLVAWSPLLLVTGLSLFHGVNNWIWLSKNAMPIGWDRINALVNSLYYHNTLSEFSLQALFKALTQDEIRPPLFGLSMALMYKLFGVSSDVAVMANMAYMALLLAASYGIGARLGNRRLGLLSAALVAFIPLLFAMSRYSYFEFSLAALTASSIYLLLASERFERRGYSVLLGITLGLGILLKRTFPVFVIGALAVVVLQAGLPRKFWARLRARPRPRWRDMGLAIAGGGLLSALWYLPNKDLAQVLPGGPWLFPLWWGIAAATIYFLLLPPDAVTNFFSCCSLGVFIGSLWYLPHSDFVQRVLRAGWGVNDPRGRVVDFGDPATYTDYLQSIIYGFSPFYVVLLLLAIALLILHWLRQRNRLLPDRWWDWNWWCILTSIAVAYTILSTSIYKEPRAITPLLPLLSVVLAGVLLALPWRRWRTALIVLAIAFGVVQLFAISYTETHWLVEQTNFRQPILGQKGIFAQGSYLEMPDSGANDRRFWIFEDILQRVEASRQREGRDTISLGIIADSSHVHIGMFAYDQLRLYPAIQLEDPTIAFPQDSAYSMVFRYDYVLVLKNKNRRAAVRQAENLILEEQRSSFEQAFVEQQIYPLPDGSEAHLFRRRYRPAEPYNAAPP